MLLVIRTFLPEKHSGTNVVLITRADCTKYSQPLSIVTPFRHNANSEKMVIIDRCDYRQRKILMFYYETGTNNTGKKCDYRQSFHMV